MAIESVMFFALGFLAAAFFALMVMPSIWRRAVRLTRRRIEAATPMTMAEFRADKDQLRAEFALSTRAMEKNIDSLRARLAETLGESNQSKIERAAAFAERDEQRQIAEELAGREAAALDHLHALEREFADVAQKLRMRDLDYKDKLAEIEALRSEAQLHVPYGGSMNGDELSGSYDEDVGSLLHSLSAERERTGQLEARARALLSELENAEQQSQDARAAIEEMRDALARKENEVPVRQDDMEEAQLRISSAETRLIKLLQEGDSITHAPANGPLPLLAEQLSMDDKLADLRKKIRHVETTILQDWDNLGSNANDLRDEMIKIASEVSLIVYASEDDDRARTAEESLFDRVQKFAGDSLGVEAIPIEAAQASASSGKEQAGLAGRMAAVRNIQIR